MRKFSILMFMLAVAVSTIGFSSCSKEEDGGIYSGATSYSGPLVGTWSSLDPNSVSDDGGWEDIMVLSADGKLSYKSENEDDDWWSEEGVFIVKENILACTYRSYEDSDGEASSEEYTEFYYIISTNNSQIVLSYLGDNEDGDENSITLDQALVMSPEDGVLETYYKK